ncbi:MAG: DNA-3-methyladenine glycosylase [Oscillospiraceae bacterium]|nr:DNA-3-methyladenine glycosylase [Oscillospiraceae bacterium]
MTASPLPRAFYLRSALQAAPELLGKLLCHETTEGLTAGRIVEVEAYVGPEDDGAHSYGGRRTERTAIQYGEGGYAYVFGIYGMHWCFNAITAAPGKPEVVLVRALEPVLGLELMEKRRKTGDPRQLCSGPGKLCQALGITKAQYGLDLCGGELYIAEGESIPATRIAVSPRVNIDYATQYKDRLWRFYIADNVYVSKVPRRFAAKRTLG